MNAGSNELLSRFIKFKRLFSTIKTTSVRQRLFSPIKNIKHFYLYFIAMINMNLAQEARIGEGLMHDQQFTSIK